MPREKQTPIDAPWNSAQPCPGGRLLLRTPCGQLTIFYGFSYGSSKKKKNGPAALQVPAFSL